MLYQTYRVGLETPAIKLAGSEMLGVVQTITGNAADKLVAEAAIAPLKTATDAIPALQAAVTALQTSPAMSAPYVKALVKADWVNDGVNSYKYTIPAATHGKGVYAVVRTLDSSSNAVGSTYGFTNAGADVVVSVSNLTLDADLTLTVLISS